MKAIALVLCAFLGWLFACQHSNTPDRKTIEQFLEKEVQVYGSYAVVRLPVITGVSIQNPVQVEPGPGGVMYAANHTGEIYSLRDTDGDGLEDHAELYCNVTEDGLSGLTSIAFRGKELYAGTAQEIRIYTDTNDDGKADTSRPFLQGIPYSRHPYEWTSALTFGPDGYLYLVITTDSWNAGASPDPKKWRGALLRVSPDGSKVERFATGLRSVHSMVFNTYNDLFFVDNEGGGNLAEELNIARRGHFYGHNPAKYGNPATEGPVHKLQTEVAPAGMVLNAPDNDFDGTAGDLFIAFYGPGERWNRGAIGRLRMRHQDDGSYSIEEFPVATGIPKVSDLAFAANGDLYVAHVGKTDYWYQATDEVDGAFFRFIHVPWITPASMDSKADTLTHAPAPLVERGRQLFAERACSACHGVDGKTQLLGPNLKDIGRTYSRQELMEEITAPSLRIKPSMMATRITKTNGEVLLGRVISTSEERVQLMIVSNRIVDIPRNEIAAEEPSPESLMYEGLLEGLPPEDIDALLTYVLQLHQLNEAGFEQRTGSIR